MLQPRGMKTKINNITGKITLHIETLFIISPCTVSGAGSPYIGRHIFSSGRHKLTPNRKSIIQAEIVVVKAKNGLFEIIMKPAETVVD